MNVVRFLAKVNSELGQASREVCRKNTIPRAAHPNTTGSKTERWLHRDEKRRGEPKRKRGADYSAPRRLLHVSMLLELIIHTEGVSTATWVSNAWIPTGTGRTVNVVRRKWWIGVQKILDTKGEAGIFETRIGS